MSIIYNGQTVAGVYAEQILNNADTINAGIIKIATQEEVDAGENNTSAVTPLYLSSKQNKLESGDNISIENDIISCDIKPDVSTIIQNEDGTLTNVGQLTKSGTIKIDWEGTEAEYTRAMLNGEIDPNWYCYITDDESLVDYADVANQSLSNLRPEGEARFDEKLDKNQITNCLLEVPQNIKLELNDGVLTLKAGFKVIIPNGANKFEELVVNDDRTISGTSGTNQKFIFIRQDGGIVIGDSIAQTGSGSTDSFAGQAWHVWYDITNNKIVRYTSDGSTPAYQMSLPIALVTAVDGVITSIDKVFNGMGYIGSTIWVDKGVKGLIPDGRNPDGTLKNIEYTTPRVTVATLSAYTNNNMPVTIDYNRNGQIGWSDWLYVQEENPNENYSNWYKPSENMMYYAGATAGDYQPCKVLLGGFLDRTNGKVTGWYPNQTFRAVDWNEFEQKADKSDLDKKVNKSGDTMTGNLGLNSASLNITGGSIFTRNTTYALDDKASTAKYEVVIQHEDKNNVRKSRIESAWLTDGSHLTAMSEKKSASENSYASIQVGWDKNGTAYATAPTPPTGDNSTKIATTAFCKNMATTTKATTTSSASATRPAWIVQNYVSGASWYRVWSDGWIEQGGTSAVFTTNPIAITLLKNFANTNYSLQFTPYGTNVRGYGITVSVKNKNNFSAVCGYCTNTGVANAANGDCKVNWYACGY